MKASLFITHSNSCYTLFLWLSGRLRCGLWVQLTLILSINIINLTSRKNMRGEKPQTDTCLPVFQVCPNYPRNISLIHPVRMTKSRDSVRLSKHCELTLQTAEHKLDIQTAVQEVNNLPFFIPHVFGFIHTTKVCYLGFMTKRLLQLNVLK